MKPDHEIPAEEMAGWLPAPAERDLAPGRQQILKEHLMSVIHTETSDTPRTGESVAAPRPRRRRAAVLVPSLATLTAAAAALVVVVVTHNGQAGPVQTNQSVRQPPVESAVRLLARVATAAGQKPAVAVRDDQYEYVESVVSFLGSSATVGENGQLTPGTSQLEPPHTRQIWLPVADLCKPGLLRERGEDTNLAAQNAPGGHCPDLGDLNNPSYRLLAGLPTDPRTLLNQIYAVEKGHGPDQESEAFSTIGDLLRESVPPPAVSAALYRAAALIPGVQFVQDAVDAAGRRGIAVAMDAHGERTEWIFDRTSLLMIGEREVLTQNGPQGRAGNVVGSTAIMAKAIVDHVGDVP